MKHCMTEMKEFSKFSIGFYNSCFMLRDFPDPLPFNPFYKTGSPGKEPPPPPASNMNNLENFKIATKEDDGKF